LAVTVDGNGRVFDGKYTVISRTVAAPCNKVAEALTVRFVSKTAEVRVADGTTATLLVYMQETQIVTMEISYHISTDRVNELYSPLLTQTKVLLDDFP
jgi:hypothetical protein